MNKLLKLLKSLKKLGFTPHIFFSKKMMRGEIATVLTLISVGMMILGAFAGTQIVKVGPRLSPFAANSGCAEVINVSQNPSTPLSASQNFTCRATLNSQYANSGNIACGWSKNGGWPQTGGRWVGANCSGVNCSFGIKMDSATDGDYQLVAFDMRSECGPYVSGAKSVPLNVNKETAPPAAATSTPATVPPGGATNTPTPAAGTGTISGTLTIKTSDPADLNSFEIDLNKQNDEYISNYQSISSKDIKNNYKSKENDTYKIPYSFYQIWDKEGTYHNLSSNQLYAIRIGWGATDVTAKEYIVTIDKCDGHPDSSGKVCSDMNINGQADFTITIPSSSQPTPTPTTAPAAGTGTISGKVTVNGQVPEGKFLQVYAGMFIDDIGNTRYENSALFNKTSEYNISNISSKDGFVGISLSQYYYDGAGNRLEEIPDWDKNIIRVNPEKCSNKLFSNLCTRQIPNDYKIIQDFTITIPSSVEPTPTPTTAPAAGTGTISGNVSVKFINNANIDNFDKVVIQLNKVETSGDYTSIPPPIEYPIAENFKTNITQKYNLSIPDIHSQYAISAFLYDKQGDWEYVLGGTPNNCQMKNINVCTIVDISKPGPDFSFTIPSSGQPTPTPTISGEGIGPTPHNVLASVPYDHTGYQTVMNLSASGRANAIDVSIWANNFDPKSRPGLKSVYCHPSTGGCDIYML